MNPTAVSITAIICVTLLIGIGIIAYAAMRNDRLNQISEPVRPPINLNDPVWKATPAPEYNYSKTELRMEPEDPREGPAFPLDPANPPKKMIWRPREGSSTPSCLCHKRPLQPGQEVILWPYQDRQIILCLEGMPKA